MIPGIGAQAGNLKLTLQYGTDDAGSGVLINVSRNILYASSQNNFATAAQQAAKRMVEQINTFRQLKQSFYNEECENESKRSLSNI